MSAGELTVQRCEGCGKSIYPRRLACGRCGGAVLESGIPAGPGHVVDIVQLYLAPGRGADSSSPAPFVLVLLDSGPRVLARSHDVRLRGERVRMEVEASGAVLAVADPPS